MFFFIFISFAYAEVPSGGWATSIIRVQTPALCCPTTVTKTPSPVGSVVCRYTCANSEPGCFADTCTFVEYTTGGSSSYAYAGCNYAKPVDDISLCSDALKSAYYGGSAPSDFSCPAGKDSVGGCNGTPKYCEGSDTYNQAMRFLAFISGMKSFSFENWIGSNGISYICVNTAILTSGRSMLYINSPAGQEPSFSTNNACVTQSAYNAANNTVCDTSGTTALNGKNTNIHKSVGSTGLTTICKDANGVYINCPGSVSTAMGGGITITQDPTGVGPTTITSPTGGTNPDGTSITKTEPVTTSGTGAGVTIGGLNTGNCYDGIKNGDEISIDKGGALCWLNISSRAFYSVT